MLRSSCPTKNSRNTTSKNAKVTPHTKKYTTTDVRDEINYTAEKSNKVTDESDVQSCYIVDSSSTSLSDKHYQRSGNHRTISSPPSTSACNNNTRGVHRRCTESDGDDTALAGKQQPTHLNKTSEPRISLSTSLAVYEISRDTKAIRHSKQRPFNQRQRPPVNPSLIYMYPPPSTSTSATLYDSSSSIPHDNHGPIPNIPDRLNHQQRQHQQHSLINIDVQQPAPLLHQIPLMEISSEENLTLPYTLAEVRDLQQNSAESMRSSKCAACYPAPPAKTSILTPPSSVGVPLFGRPPDPTVKILPKHFTDRCSSSPPSSLSSRRSRLYNQSNRHHQHPPSNGIDRRRCNGKSNTPAHVGRKTRINQSRRSSIPNLAACENQGGQQHLSTPPSVVFGNQGRQRRSSAPSSAPCEDLDRHQRLSSPTPQNSVQHSKATGANGNDANKLSLRYWPLFIESCVLHDKPIIYRGHSYIDRPNLYGMPKGNYALSSNRNNSNTSYDSTTACDRPNLLDETNGYYSPNFYDRHTSSSIYHLSTLNSPHLKNLLSKVLRCEYAHLLDNTHDPLHYPLEDRSHSHPLPLTVIINDIIQQYGLIQGHLFHLEQRLLAMLDVSQSSLITTASDTSPQNFQLQQLTSGLSSATLVADGDSHSIEDKPCTTSPLSVGDLGATTASIQSLDYDLEHHHQREHTSSTRVAGMEQWTTKLRLVLSRWLVDLNHGYLKNYETTPDGSITTMVFSGYVATMETFLVSHLLKTDKLEFSRSPLDKQPIYHNYTLSLSCEQRRETFSLGLPDSWVSDEQVDYCQFQSSVPCQCKFNWVNRRHHCRKCGDIFCNAHSSNRLPLFTKENSNQVKWSRVCDSCCYHLVGPYLVRN